MRFGEDGRVVIRSWLLRSAAVYPALMTILLIGSLVVPPRSGPLEPAVVMAPQLPIAALVLVPFVVARDAAWLRRSLIALLVVSVLRFGSEWVSIPAVDQGSVTLRAMSWNIQRHARTAADDIDSILASDVDVIALHELPVDYATTIDSDPRIRDRYPYRTLAGRDDFQGVGLLSRIPMSGSTILSNPSGIEAHMASSIGPLTFITAHPLPGRFGSIGLFGPPLDFDPSTRDGDLDRLRERAEASIARGERVILMGDFNTTPTEAAYRDLVRSLRDVHVDVGLGPGWTWRPTSLEGLGVGLLRIDMALVGPGIKPRTIAEHCLPAGDHCQLLIGVSAE